MHPKVKDEVTSIVSEVDKALTGKGKFIITQGLRSFAESDSLYAQGRTKPGNIVTNAKAGQSIHNYGLAFDFVISVGGIAKWDTKTDWDEDKQSDWMEVVNIFKSHGWSWGGDWKSLKDYPHLEKTFGNTWQTLLDKKNKGQIDKDGYVLV